MTDSLTSLLDGKENLKCSFFAILLQGTNFYSGYWGLSDNNLLGAVLTFSGKEVSYTIKVPLEIKKFKIRKSLFPKQYIVKIKFFEGSPCKLRVPLKAYQIESRKKISSYFARNSLENRCNKQTPDGYVGGSYLFTAGQLLRNQL